MSALVEVFLAESNPLPGLEWGSGLHEPSMLASGTILGDGAWGDLQAEKPEVGQELTRWPWVRFLERCLAVPRGGWQKRAFLSASGASRSRFG